MNHQRFGWHEDERPEWGRGSYEREQYPRGRGFGGGRHENYDDMDYGRTGRGATGEEYRGREGYGMGRMGGDGGYYRGLRSDEQERDRYGRFVSEGGGRGYGRGMQSFERDRDEYGRFVSEGDGHGYGRGMQSFGRDRDEYGRFVSEGDGRGYGRSMSGLHGMHDMPRDEQGRFTSERSGGYGRRMGQHTGRGPKNYQRSDERIREEVCDRLEQDGDIDASEMDVKVQNGLVTLTGNVESREEKHMAEQLAEECSGVKDVLNQLKVSVRQGEQGRMGSSQHTNTQGDQKEHSRKSA
jgi:hypothetical protein